MNIKVAAFTVGEKSSNTEKHVVATTVYSNNTPGGFIHT